MIPTILIARLTLTESLRRKLAPAAFLLGGAFLVVFGVGFHFIHQDVQNHIRAHGDNAVIRMTAISFVVMAGLYAGNMLAMMASVLVAIDTLAGEIASGVLDAICARPVRRSSILIGKWAGCAVLVLALVVFLLGGVVIVARAVSGFTPPGVIAGLTLVYLEGLVLMTVSLVAGTRLSPLAGGMVAFGLYGLAFIGGWVEQIGSTLGNATARLVGIAASLIMPTESLWHLASYRMQPPLVRDLALLPFAVVSVPSTAMIAWAVAFVLGILALGVRLFNTRDLS